MSTLTLQAFLDFSAQAFRLPVSDIVISDCHGVHVVTAEEVKENARLLDCANSAMLSWFDGR